MLRIRSNASQGIARGCIGVLAAAGLLLGIAATARAEVQVYGFAMLDMGYQVNQNDPAWFDVVRPTKLPAFDNEFGEDGHWFAGVRQSRLGVKSNTSTDAGDLSTIFEFEMFGVGADAGQTTIRLRHAFGRLGEFGFGQTWSPFMDIDVFPNSIEYWGPNGMAFFRNVQGQWMREDDDSRFAIALERPGASADAGIYEERLLEEEDLRARFPVPDVSAELRLKRSWGYVEGAGIVRKIKWDDLDPDLPDFSGDVVGWGINLSSNIKAGDRGLLRLSALYGEGIENYMNDAPEDVGVKEVDADGDVEGEALPVTGIVAFYDINWNERWSSSVGYSMVDIDNSSGQAGTAFKHGDYGLVNLLHYPAKNVMVGGEVQYGRRENKNGYDSDDLRFQFSARYNFSSVISGL